MLWSAAPPRSNANLAPLNTGSMNVNAFPLDVAADVTPGPVVTWTACANALAQPPFNASPTLGRKIDPADEGVGRLDCGDSAEFDPRVKPGDGPEASGTRVPIGLAPAARKRRCARRPI